MREYYINLNGNQQGPYTIDELRNRRDAGNLPPESHVWADGMDEWSPVHEVLSSATPPVPPPVVDADFEGSAAPRSSEAIRASVDQEPLWQRRLSMGDASFVLGAASFLILLIMALLPAEPSGPAMALIFIVVGILGTGAVFTVLIAVILGIISICRRQANMIFPVVGIILSILGMAVITI